jgi:hypothetical protein
MASATSHVERLAVRSNSERERRVRHWNRAPAVLVAARIGVTVSLPEDVECPSIGRSIFSANSNRLNVNPITLGSAIPEFEKGNR